MDIDDWESMVYWYRRLQMGWALQHCVSSHQSPQMQQDSHPENCKRPKNTYGTPIGVFTDRPMSCSFQYICDERIPTMASRCSRRHEGNFLNADFGLRLPYEKPGGGVHPAPTEIFGNKRLKTLNRHNNKMLDTESIVHHCLVYGH